jgi:hypothetical protein
MLLAHALASRCRARTPGPLDALGVSGAVDVMVANAAEPFYLPGTVHPQKVDAIVLDLDLEAELDGFASPSASGAGRPPVLSFRWMRNVATSALLRHTRARPLIQAFKIDPFGPRPRAETCWES